MKKFSILVIDDEKNFVFTLSEIFKAQNWSVDVANNGYDALELLKKKRYEVILSDIRMPGIDGVQTFHEIKKLQTNSIICLMTGGPTEHLKELQKEGVFTVLQKPINVTEIINMISGLEGKGNVLVVDDNESDRVMLNDILLKKGYRVMTAENGKEAIVMVKKIDFDAVLLDMRLPDIDGLSVLDEIKKIRPAAAVMAITGFSLDEVIETAIQKGAVTCFIKPFNIEMLLRELNLLVNKKKGNVYFNEIEPAKILVLDNDEVSSEVIKYVLMEEGFDVQTVDNFQQFERKLHSKEYDILILSSSMLKEADLAAVNDYRDKNRNIIIINIAGQKDKGIALESINNSFDEYILKPVTPSELLHKVKVHFEKRMLINEKENLEETLQAANIKLLELDNTDQLTGSYNRRSFFDQLHIEMERAKRQKTPFTLIMCDIDKFKDYNARHGYSEGDKVLKEIAAMLQLSIRKYIDRIFRYGNDEFAVIIPGLLEQHAHVFIERITSKLTENGLTNQLNISIGLDCFDERHYKLNMNEFIELVEKKLIENKKTKS